MAESYILQTEQMTVGYNGVALIENVELCLKRGEIVTLIGANGSGKSTVLKSLIGQLRLLGGTVYLNGEHMARKSRRDVARSMAVLMTDRIHPEKMTCWDVVSAGRYPYTGRLGVLNGEDKRKVREALEQVNGVELAERPFSAISDGQRQRILLARALCQEPEIIVLDEPTTFLDIRYQLELLAILKRLARERHMAVLLSLHELELAQRVSDWVLCVNNGHIERQGTPEEVFTSEYIRQLYHLKAGSYHPEFGHLELERVTGEPKVFVIGGGGSAVACYRRLQREGIPFATGVLHENDIDYLVARALAVELVTECAFEPISEQSYERALELLQRCERVICTVEHFGAMNERNRMLLNKAKCLKKLH